MENKTEKKDPIPKVGAKVWWTRDTNGKQFEGFFIGFGVYSEGTRAGMDTKSSMLVYFPVDSEILNIPLDEISFKKL